jgi:PQQ-dependent dehydrogenase (s-GDH family)
MLVCICLSTGIRPAAAQNSDMDFMRVVLNQKPSLPAQRYRLAHPFEIFYGPDDHLFVTERVGRVLRVNTTTGVRQVILDHRASTFITISRNGAGTATSIGQDGMMGMALHPNFGQGTGQDFIYIAYTYASGQLRISRFSYAPAPTPQLSSETVLLQGIPANNDHSSGRLVFGADGQLYYTCGDRGANQFGNRCLEIQSQKLPTAAQLSAANYTRYAGKTLRIAPDGSIPPDNPLFEGVRSHIFSIGHRNAQGMVTQKSPTDGLSFPVPAPGGRLFNSEHGPRTDDEINVLQAGGNYGWPYVSGYLDNLNYSYVIWATSPSCSSTPYSENTVPPGAMVRQESDSALTNFQPPLSTLYTVCAPLPLSVCNAGGTNWMRYPTIAPSSIDFYHVQTGLSIPGWYPSLLVPTLRRGVLYRYKLNAAMDGFEADSIPYFRSTNRYRDIAISADGRKIYLVTDSIGSTSGPSGNGTSSLDDPGAILEFSYVGATLSLPGQTGPGLPEGRQYGWKLYPNPAVHWIRVDIGEDAFRRFVDYQLTDVNGRVVLKGRSLQRQFTVDLRGLAPGMYVYRMRDGLGLDTGSEKIIIRH